MFLLIVRSNIGSWVQVCSVSGSFLVVYQVMVRLKLLAEIWVSKLNFYVFCILSEIKK